MQKAKFEKTTKEHEHGSLPVCNSDADVKRKYKMKT
jgi:hypothetical protein